MGVRLILVSVVAGLGLTLPSGKQITSWRDSARGWVSTRLAEWDARMPADESAFIYVANADTLPGDEHEARKITTTIKTKTLDTVTADSPAPITINAAAASSPAPTSPEILAAGIETPTSPMAIDDVELIPITTETNTASALAALDTAFHEAQSQTLSTFAAEAIHLANAEKSVPKSEPYLAITDQLLSVEPSALEDSDDLQEGTSYLFALEADVKPVPSETEAIRSRNEPLESYGDLYTGMAFELNRQADGLNALLEQEIGQTVSNDRIGDSRPEMIETSSRLGSALKLTREAVYAWANLLHAPVVVTINH